ncbi:MAG: DUF1736 domain-containing protein, partial [Bacteroidia bacterium]|nr:DUF1736 domain-containing protein [Bacteroidia bacterium]
TIPNRFALDDAVSITENKITQQGIAGIPDLLTKDSFYGFLGDGNDLAGGRYRPLALITFAIEQSLWKGNPHIAHTINVLLYAFCGWLLIGFLRTQIFHEQPLAVLVAGILFIIHPIHTEVVANIKSRDELLSLLFLLLSLSACLRWITSEKIMQALLSGFLFLLSLLAKETALPFLVITPLLLWYQRKRVQQIVKGSIPIWVAIVVYLIVRFSVTGLKLEDSKELLNNPYLNASVEQKYATIIWVLGKYLWLLFFPIQLAYDYSYNQIPLKTFLEPTVLLSILIYAGIKLYGFRGMKQRTPVSFGIWWYLLTISLVSNIVINIGAPMGERFLFQPSIGFAIVVGGLASQLNKKWLLPAMVLIVSLAFARTVTRNTDWKDEQTLLIRDIEKVPNSARACNGAGVALIKIASETADPIQQQKLYLQAIEYLNRGNQIYPGNLHGYLNLGVAYSRLDSVEAAERSWNLARRISPNFPKLKEYDYYLVVSYKNRGASAAASGDSSKAFESFHKSLQY